MVKRRAVVILLSIMIISLFSGCSEQEIEQGLGDIGGYIQQVQDTHTETIESEQTTETDMPESEETLEELPSIYYAYHTLDKEGQKLYLEIYRSLQRMETDTAVSTLDIDELNTVFQYVLADHPELFYVEGYQYTQYTTGNAMTKLTFTGTYTMTWENVQQTMQRIETVAEQMTVPLAQITDQYTIIRYLYDSLIIATEYDSNAENNQNIQSVFLDGRSVCQGYAKAMQYLLQKEGIQTLLVTGQTNGEGHAWDLVLADGEYYYLDPTWGDASYSKAEESTENVRIPSINYDYFLVTTQELEKTHQLDESIPLPECMADADNYYVHEGLYLDTYNEDQIKWIFEKAQQSQTGYITMKCSNAEVYSQTKEKLIDEQEVFHFLQTDGNSISYTMNETQLTLSFLI